ncbi:hypothetical protein ATO6_18825 [Oceanicola sp. 22II-s10i]|uniref:LysR family transcriptional regulator n=1 Tax=Oceanicola sp. 22II-s10i TaxID=1317116 RepID=UPI000B5265B3|nr:LysR family transcriptional regulator [Oceanicola sp. 22II-s10i]OWU83486.1 hypothetical protein ATO6_18825 [Oceanicola sp. 22II-s10i]
MELKLLEDFLCLADQLSFSRAAEMRHVTQSTFSKRIRSLEHWFGADLVDRSSHPVTLTPEGAAAIAPSREIVQMMHGLREGISKFPKQPANAVSFAALHTLLVTFMPAWRKSIEAQMGKINLGPMYQNTEYASTLRMLRNGDVDFLLTYSHHAVAMNLPEDKFESITLAQERIIPASAPDANGRPLHAIRPDSVLNYISYGSSSFFASAVAALLAERPLALNVMASNAMSVGLRSQVLVGTGLAWLPESLIRQDLADGRLVLGGDEEWEFTVDVKLVRGCNRRPTPDLLWEVARRLVPQTQPCLGAEVLI